MKSTRTTDPPRSDSERGRRSRRTHPWAGFFIALFICATLLGVGMAFPPIQRDAEDAAEVATEEQDNGDEAVAAAEPDDAMVKQEADVEKADEDAMGELDAASVPSADGEEPDSALESRSMASEQRSKSADADAQSDPRRKSAERGGRHPIRIGSNRPTGRPEGGDRHGPGAGSERPHGPSVGTTVVEHLRDGAAVLDLTPDSDGGDGWHQVV